MTVALAGSYRSSSRQEVRKQLEPAETALQSVIDVTDVSDADAGLVAELVTLSQLRRRSGLPALTLVARRPSDAVWALFDLCGIAMACRFESSPAFHYSMSERSSGMRGNPAG